MGPPRYDLLPSTSKLSVPPASLPGVRAVPGQPRQAQQSAYHPSRMTGRSRQPAAERGVHAGWCAPCHAHRVTLGSNLGTNLVGLVGGVP
jgi:hypothetical protein